MFSFVSPFLDAVDKEGIEKTESICLDDREDARVVEQ